MARDSGGTFSLAAGNPVVTGTTITAAWANPTLSDIAAELTDSLSRSGKGGMLAAFKIADGTVGAPGLAFTNETSSGLYRTGANDVNLAIGGTRRFRFTATDAYVYGTGTLWAVQNDNTASLQNNLTLARGTGAGTTAILKTVSTGANDVGQVRFSIGATDLITYNNSSIGLGATSATGISISFNDGVGGSQSSTVCASATSGRSGISVYVPDGARNHRATLFTDDTNSLWGLSESYSSGSRPFLIRIGTAERLRLRTDGILQLASAGTFSDPSVSAGLLYFDTAGGVFTMASRSVANEASLAFRVTTSGVSRQAITVAHTGAVTISAPSAAGLTPLTVTSQGVGQVAATFTDGTNFYTFTTAATNILNSSAPLTINIGGTAALNFSANRNITIPAPSSGISVAVTGVASGTTQTWTDGTVTATVSFSSSIATFGASSNHATRLISNGAERLLIAAAGNVTVNAPASGTTLTVNCATAQTAESWSDATVTGNINFSSTVMNFGSTTAHSLILKTNATTRITITSAGVMTVAAPSAGVALTVRAVSGTHSVQIADSANALFNAGYLELPINTQNANYTAVLADAGKAIYHSDGTAYTYTIPANASVAYPVGTTLTFVNDASGAVNITIAITTDTMMLSPGGTTTTFTLARYGRATAHKVTSTRWIISGSGLTGT